MSARSSATAEAAFRARLAELGAELLEPYKNNKTPHRVRCAAGHFCTPYPSSVVLAGKGVCRTCAGQDPVAAETRFRARLAELRAELLEPVWLGVNTPHRVRCAAGHECSPWPTSVLGGQGICRACAGSDPAAAEAAFRARLAELGAELLEPYHGSGQPHRVRCAAGHECMPRPSGVQQGVGICHICGWQGRDAFYIVRQPTTGHIKFGITSGDPQWRLRRHRACGYSERVLVLTGLPGTTAPEIESAAIAVLKLAEIKPIRGREYYDSSALALVLDVVDNYPAAA
jgi:hypothetical protein